MKKQKRYSAAYEIQAEIIAYKQKAQRKLALAESLEEQALAKIKLSNDPSTDKSLIDFIGMEINKIRNKERRARRAYFLIHDQHIPQLVRTMGAFKTVPMPFLEDNAVTLQK
jgi:hypothetical protein